MNDRRLGSRIGLLIAFAVFAASSNALANTLTQNVSWTIDRAGTTTKYRVVAYGDSIYAGYNGSTTQRREVRGAHGRRRVPVGTVERRHREHPPRQVGRGGLRHLQQQDRRRAIVHAGQHHPRRDLRDVRQRRPAGAQQLQGPDRHLQLRRADHRA